MTKNKNTRGDNEAYLGVGSLRSMAVWLGAQSNKGRRGQRNREEIVVLPTKPPC